jgi:hypothetical protein
MSEPTCSIRWKIGSYQRLLKFWQRAFDETWQCLIHVVHRTNHASLLCCAIYLLETILIARYQGGSLDWHQITTNCFIFQAGFLGEKWKMLCILTTKKCTGKLHRDVHFTCMVIPRTCPRTCLCQWNLIFIMRVCGRPRQTDGYAVCQKGNIQIHTVVTLFTFTIKFAIKLPHNYQNSYFQRIMKSWNSTGL